ncbi:MAG: hypothetical protein ACXWTW_00065 [Methylobacter sp.]
MNPASMVAMKPPYSARPWPNISVNRTSGKQVDRSLLCSAAAPHSKRFPCHEIFMEAGYEIQP